MAKQNTHVKSLYYRTEDNKPRLPNPKPACYMRPNDVQYDALHNQSSYLISENTSC